MELLDKEGLSHLWDRLRGLVLPAGGTAGQVLAKASDADHDVQWADPPAAVSKAQHYTAPLAAGLTGNVTYWRTGEGVVTLRVAVTKTSAIAAWESVATIPEGFRSAGQVNFVALGENRTMGYLSLYANGGLTVNKYNFPAGTLIGTASYIAYG